MEETKHCTGLQADLLTHSELQGQYQASEEKPPAESGSIQEHCSDLVLQFLVSTLDRETQ